MDRLTVWQAITAVKRDLGAVSKDRKMEAGPARYSYRSIDDVLNKLHEPLITHGLVMIPMVDDVIQTEAGTTKAGTAQTRTVVRMSYLIVGPSGNDVVTARTVGEAIDSGDKGTNKAGTSALKQLLTQLFAIPFATDDPDDSYVEMGHGNNRAVQQAESPANRGSGPMTLPPPTNAKERRSGGNAGTSGLSGQAAFIKRRLNSLGDPERDAVIRQSAEAQLKPIDQDMTPEDANRWLALMRGVLRAGEGTTEGSSE
jgi:ERF superfamily